MRMKQTLFACFMVLLGIKAHAQDANMKWYSAGEIQSKTSVQYGRFEFMMYSSDMSGTTSTFFLWKDGGQTKTSRWNELDVETFGKSPNEWQSNPIWEYYATDTKTKRWEAYHTTIPIANTWVKFTLEWTPNYIAWFNNGVQVRRINKGENVPASHFRYAQNPDSKDPVTYIADAMRMCFNHWSAVPGAWLGNFNPADLPSFQFVDWLTYQKWNGTGFDAVSIRQDFNSLAEVQTNYNISTHTISESNATFQTANVGVTNGMLWLSVTGYNTARSPAGGEIPTPSGVVANTAPTINITAPVNGSSVTSGTNITITANAADTAPGTVSLVSFYDGAALLGTDTTSPYSYTWAGASVGNHTITAKATDNNGATKTSTAVTVTVNAIVVNDPLTASYFFMKDVYTGDYMRPTLGLPTALITQYEEAVIPTFDSYQWEFKKATGGYYYIINKYTKNAIQPTNGSVAENAGLSQVAFSNQINDEVLWSITPSGDGNYWIKNKKSGLYIRPYNGTNGGQGTIAIVQNTLVVAYSSFKWSLTAVSAKTNAKIRATTEVSTDASNDVLTFYPNPASDFVTLSKVSDWNLYNSLGMKVLSGSGTTINVSNLSKGMYFLKVKETTFKVLVN